MSMHALFVFCAKLLLHSLCFSMLFHVFKPSLLFKLWPFVFCFISLFCHTENWRNAPWFSLVFIEPDAAPKAF